jgi:outer membrane protein assembly factor BamD (BamD/ComL family)
VFFSSSVTAGAFHQAIEHLESIHHMDAELLHPAHFSHPHFILAEIYLRRGDRTNAVEELKDFLKRHPDDPKAATVRAHVAALAR